MTLRTVGVVLAIAAAGLLTSCRTTEPVWFIATPGYVEARLAAQEETLRRDYDARIEELEARVESQRRVSDELAGLASVIRDVEASNAELRSLAAQVEDEISGLPQETIRIIVEVLARHLEPQP